MLDRLLGKLPLDERDTLVFLGDYVDRGPDSRGVIDTLLALKARLGERCVCLLGNHEDMMLDFWRQKVRPWYNWPDVAARLKDVPDYGGGFWLSVGGAETVRSYAGDIPIEHILFLASLPLRHDRDGYIFVHAGLCPQGPTSRPQMLWQAPGFWTGGPVYVASAVRNMPDLPGDDLVVVVGHTAFQEPVIGKGIIGIDTGCGFSGPLTAVQLPDMVFFQEPAESWLAFVRC
jgi:serine/threonine protein phosphatase 1